MSGGTDSKPSKIQLMRDRRRHSTPHRRQSRSQQCVAVKLPLLSVVVVVCLYGGGTGSQNQTKNFSKLTLCSPFRHCSEDRPGSKRVCENSANRQEQSGTKHGRDTHSTASTAGIQKSSQTDICSPPTESCSSSLKPVVTTSKPIAPQSHSSTYTPCLRERRKRCTPRRGLPGLMFRIPRSPKPGLTFGRIRNRNRIGAPFHMRRYDMFNMCTIMS